MNSVLSTYILYMFNILTTYASINENKIWEFLSIFQVESILFKVFHTAGVRTFYYYLKLIVSFPF